MFHRWVSFSAVATAFFACIGGLAGCQKVAPPTPAPVTIEPVDRSSPVPLARGALRLVQQDLAAIAARKPADAEAYRTALAKLVSVADIEKELKSKREGNSIAAEEVVKRLVINWTATISYYAKGIDFEHASEQEAADTSGRVAVVFPAQGRSGGAEILVECERAAEGQWALRRIDFASPIRWVVSAPKPRAVGRTAVDSAPASGPTPRPTPTP